MVLALEYQYQDRYAHDHRSGPMECTWFLLLHKLSLQLQYILSILSWAFFVLSSRPQTSSTSSVDMEWSRKFFQVLHLLPYSTQQPAWRNHRSQQGPFPHEVQNHCHRDSRIWSPFLQIQDQGRLNLRVLHHMGIQLHFYDQRSVFWLGCSVHSASTQAWSMHPAPQ